MAKSSTSENTAVIIDGVKIPVKVHYEWRSDIRFSIAKKAAHLRLPFTLRKRSKVKEWNRFESWLRQSFAMNPHLKSRFLPRRYKDGEILMVGEKKFQINFKWEDRKNNLVKLIDNTIEIRLKSDLHDDPDLHQLIGKMVARAVARSMHGTIVNRVKVINDAFFGVAVSNVRLRNNVSNWGSCSTRGNINLSTRLLFAPPKVIDYVIIHELAHRKVFNHSKEFWQIVKSVMPDYKEQERWLNENGHLCKF